jgi:serine/threonine-protein kinase
LRVLALLLAFVFTMSNFVSVLVVGGEELAHFFSSVSYWGPGAISIVLALALAVLCGSPRISDRVLLNIGLVFEVVVSFGIAAAEYSEFYAPIQVAPGDFGGVGLSWVSVWILLFTVVVPSRPRIALLAALASASSVPITFANTLARTEELAFVPTPSEFFVAFVLQYLLVVLMAYVGARVVYKLGTDISRAQEMGSYRLTRLLGRGGMGEVWMGRHRMLARPAAIKIVDPAILGGADLDVRQTMIGRFEREAQATAAMRSPHTVELFDYGVTEDETFYYVMEFLDGYDLDTLITRFGPIPAERAIHLLKQICHSLAEAHEADLIHRDIKPANVYACRYGREVDFVKVLDFGLVKTEPGPEDPKLTAQEVVGGTPAHMAPEQVLEAGSVDGRTDLYAVGCVAYWLVTGHLVFENESMVLMIADHARTEPTPPSERTELEIPESLEKVILWCLAKDPGKRPQTADELNAALDACTVPNPWTQERAQAWWKLHGPTPQPESSV